ncbi:actin-domain-containing protein [Sistotremastrum suecicum HHB10207 ss-3]|uniref:Actin-domain-containing protein n=1 Tax=Sistotremastrum suecicum HHB10207 ss-3 TaxID=1314776 RepID=A0A166E2G7_9AGAM|nr:actin-domain-containing protein [Sistotremastrum suecicum HHB10207 ss-3]
MSVEFPSTPRRQASFDPTTPASTRPTGVISSPHYTTTRRHSLYGTEDRIVIDPGSHIWKVGFSGEGRPRDVFFVDGLDKRPLWSLSGLDEVAGRGEEDTVLYLRLKDHLRRVFHSSLMADPRARKVIIVEHPLLPLRVKETLARALFTNLQAPSISFASSSLLSLLAVGRVTGLVLDCGHLESTALPIFSSRPLYTHLKTTPLAGARFNAHIKALLLQFASYIPPLPNLGSSVSIPTADRITRVPEELLTDAVVEEIKTRCCFASNPIDLTQEPPSNAESTATMTVPDSDSIMSEAEQESTTPVTMSRTSNVTPGQPEATSRQSFAEAYSNVIEEIYKPRSTATDVKMTVSALSSAAMAQPQSVPGMGTLIIPGWIRERAAELFFEGGDIDELSIAEVILHSLLKVPIDLRSQLASSILIVGGTAMLPGFITRLRKQLLLALEKPARPPGTSPSKRFYDPFATLRPMKSVLSIVNDPNHGAPASATTAHNAGRAPAYSPAALPWVGGSLTGSLKIGGQDMSREKWDQAEANANTETDIGESSQTDPGTSARSQRHIVMPDWTHKYVPWGHGPPPANTHGLLTVPT